MWRWWRRTRRKRRRRRRRGRRRRRKGRRRRRRIRRKRKTQETMVQNALGGVADISARPCLFHLGGHSEVERHGVVAVRALHRLRGDAVEQAPQHVRQRLRLRAGFVAKQHALMGGSSTASTRH